LQALAVLLATPAPAWTAGMRPRSGAGTGVFTHNLVKISALAS